MIYKTIVGSRSYGLSVGHSDVDIGMVSDKRPQIGSGCDVYLWKPEDFVTQLTGSKLEWYGCQWLFPHEFLIVNDLLAWIVESRETMIKALLPEIYQSYNSASVNFVLNSHGRHGKNKRIMYAIHFRNMLANYAEGMTFAEALKPQGADRTFLLSVRNGIAPRELVLEENAKARERAKAVAGFYAEPRADTAILDEFKRMVYREVENLKKQS